MILHLRNIHVLSNRIIYTINQVFVVLHGEKLLININKCTFKQQEHIYLILCHKKNGLSIKLRNILTIVDWIPLNNIHHLLDFMRMVSYLRYFTVHLSHVAHPLNGLNHTYVQLGGHATKAFKEIKHWVVVALLLTLTSINQAFNFKLDASN